MANAQTIQLQLKAVGDFSDVIGDIQQVQQMLTKLKLPDSLRQNFNNIFSSLTKETTKYQQILSSGFKTKKDATGLEASGNKINQLLQKMQSEINKIDPSILENSFQVDPSKLQILSNELKTLKGQLNQEMGSKTFQDLKQKVDGAAQSLAKVSKTKLTTNFTEAFNSGDIEGAASALQQLEAHYTKFKQGSAGQAKFGEGLEQFRQALDSLKGNTELERIQQQIQLVDSKMDSLDADELKKFNQTFQQGKTSIQGMTQEVQQFTQQTQQAASTQSNFSSQISQLKSQASYFFGLTNAVYLFRRALTGALNTVKELDAVMTETAVVTDFSVGDMWKRLPEYTSQATKLGASVKDLYSATTLYYQQGLNTQQAMQLGIETMKMARIAGMDATEATQDMTAALRGFNMELNELSAIKVNDVYSELAAITAADTSQIATAMTKTASIAANANMEFETTAALLAQIIETTQEAPETAGTAMKTIIARFSEVKKLSKTGQTKGQDEEGEDIDVNKIETALKTAGISMDNFFKGTEGLDSILLKLAEKWSTLDFETQRYIATMAAGSRQQSRFIAMMSDYERTVELVGAATNSSGASQLQFSKTLEGIEAKVTKLKNAWNQFLMGIANNTILKGAVDILTALITGLNRVIDLISGGNGIIKSIFNLGLAFAGLKIGGAVVNGLLTAFAGIKETGRISGALFRDAFMQEFSGVGASIRQFFTFKFFTPVGPTVKDVAALEAYNGAVKKSAVHNQIAVKSEQMVAQARRNNINTTALEMMTERNKAKATQYEAKSQLLLKSAYDLTDKEQKEAILLKQLGISTDSAVLLAKKKITEASLKEAAMQELGAQASEKDIRAKMGQLAAQSALSVAYELNEQQMKEVVALQALGLTGDQAAALAKRNLTATYFKEIAVQMLGKNATEKEIAAKAKALAMEMLSTKTKLGALLITGKNIIMTKMGIISTIASAAAQRLEALGWTQKTAAMVASYGIMGLIIVAVVALIAVIILLVRAIKDSTDTARLEHLNEQFKALGEVAEEAKNKIEELADARSGLDSLQDGFKDLIKGTVQWRQHLVETNQEVLKLINAYPELTSMKNAIIKGGDGQLMISDEAWDYLTNEQMSAYGTFINAQSSIASQKDYLEHKIMAEEGISQAWIGTKRAKRWAGATATTAAALGGAAAPVLGDATATSLAAGTVARFGGRNDEKLQQKVAQARMDTGAFLDTKWGKFTSMAVGQAVSTGLLSFLGPVGTAIGVAVGHSVAENNSEEKAQRDITGGLSLDEMSSLASALIEQGVTISDGISDDDKDKIKDMYLAMGYSAENFDEVFASISKMGGAFDELGASAMAVKNAEEARVKATLTNLAQQSNLVSSSEYGQFAQNITAQAFSNYDELVQKEVDELASNRKTKKAKKRDLQEQYAEVSGLTLDEIRAKVKDKSLSAETMQSAIAAKKIDDKAIKAMEAMTNKLEDLNNGTTENTRAIADLSGLMTDGGLGLTKAGLKRILGDGGKAFTLTGDALNNYFKKDAENNDGYEAMKKYLEDSFTNEDLINLNYVTEDGEADWSKFIADTINNAKKAIVAEQSAYRTADRYGLKEQAEASLGALDKELLELGSAAGLSIEQTQKMANAFADISINGGNAAGLINKIPDMLAGLSGTALDSAMDLIANTDWTLQSSVDSTILALQQMGAAIEENFAEQIYLITRAVKTLNLEALEADLKKFGESIDKVAEKIESSSQSFSKEERDALVDSGIKPEMFYRIDLDEYIYMGDTNDLLEQLNENTLNILKQMEADINESVQRGKIWEILLNNPEDNKEISVNGQKFASMKEFALNVVNGGLKAEDFAEGDRKELYGLINLLDLGLTGEELGIFSTEGLIAMIAEHYNQNYGRNGVILEGHEKLQEQYGVDIQSIEYSRQVGTSDFTKVIANDLSGAEAALDAAIVQETGLGERVVKTTKAFEKQLGASKKLTAQIKNHMLAVRKQEKEIDLLNKTLEEEAENLSSVNEQTRYAAVEKIGEEARNVFGVHFTNDMVEQNKELFQAMAQGGEEAEVAFRRLAEISMQKYIETLKLAETDTQSLMRYVEQIGNLDFGITGTADFSDIFAQIALLLGDAKAADDFLTSMGYAVTWERDIRKDTILVTGDANTGYSYSRLPGYTAKITRTGASGSGFSPSGSGGGSSESYENSHDKFYNTYEKINALLREREQIERRYDKLLKKRSVSAKELLENSRQELANLEAEREQQEKLEIGKLQQIRDLMSKNSKYNQYVTGFNEVTGEITINWDALETLRSSEKGEAVDDYISELEGLRDQWQEAQDELDSIEDTIIEIRERGEDEYFQLEDQIKEALVNSRQKEIDKLTEINDSINDTNSRILDSMQKQIDEYRQNRDNEKTEEEIADKQRKLAYLQMDSSGANATEILKLQKEIEDSQESYTDTLIDQKISELQEQNDQAAEQRQRQIDILQSQLDQYQESGAVWADVYKLMQMSVDETGRLKEGSYLAQILQDAAEYSGLSNLGKEEWQREMAQTFAAAFGYIGENRRAKEGEEVTFTTADKQTVTGISDATGNITTEDGKTYTDVHQTSQGDWITSEEYQFTPPSDQPEEENGEEENTISWPYSEPKPSTATRILKYGSQGDDVKGLQLALKDMGYGLGEPDGRFGPKTEDAVKAFQKDAKAWQPNIGEPDGKVGPQTREAFATHPTYKYKTGGLADFTGPAWLDGTKAKPEYVLNADQTRAFFNLVDVLGSLQTKPSQSTQNNGDNTFDIDINVESIGSDYDVEQLAETVKRLINDDARYRNNNAINLMR